MQKQLAQVQVLQKKMEEKQAEIDLMEATSTSGGGAVSVTVSGKKEISKIEIQKDVVDPEDVEMLQDLIITAANEALRQMEEISNNEMNKLTGGMGLGM
ncbi:MAG: YbaB/EbfC family nucleoid-associated protein [Eubacteriales bacterium]|nr:YbaB/EbfC family nucleoid-associated protein [Eubacteriales bacterium]MDD4390732.1 YbaB/EbfC family nucleoid-associated protein [Eubacteriales bacterium]